MKNFIIPVITGLFLIASVHAQSTVDSIESKYKLLPMPNGITIDKTFPVLGTYQLNTPGSTGANNTTTNTNTTSSDNSNGSVSTTTTVNNSTVNASSNNTSTGGGNTVTVTLDSSNKGIVWIDGLPEGKMKAYLKKSPATYRIVSQKTSSGKEISEGTMIYNPDNNTLNIVLGAPYNESDPSGIFNAANASLSTDVSATEQTPKSGSKVKVKTKNGTTKTKSRVMFYTASKSLTTSSSNTANQ